LRLQSDAVKQVAVVFHLRPGAEPAARELIASGPPFDPAAAGFERFAIYLGQREAIFVFEAEEAEWRVDELVDDFLQPALRARLDEWRKLSDVRSWPAQPVFFWERGSDSKREQT
jgi:hypothetical protein